jgi:hypothetical protein
MLGISLLFVDARNVLGWLLAAAGLAIIGAGILTNLTIFFRPTSLFNTLLMLAGRLGLMTRALRPR